MTSMSIHIFCVIDIPSTMRRRIHRILWYRVNGMVRVSGYPSLIDDHT